MRRAIVRWLANWRSVTWLVVILALIGAAYYWGFFRAEVGTTAGSYDTAKSDIQQAVTSYRSGHEGHLPVLNRTVTVDGEMHHLIDMCVLAYGGEFLADVPAGCAYDNCVTGRCTCTEGSYIWTVDEGGNVSSTCVALNCEAYQSDGYQGVWP
jgi:hypothetical protein